MRTITCCFKVDYDNLEDALKINLLEKISKSKEKRRKAKVDKFVHEKVPGDTKLYPIKVKSERSTDGISVIRDDEAMDCFNYYAFVAAVLLSKMTMTLLFLIVLLSTVLPKPRCCLLTKKKKKKIVIRN